ncbi:RICIN domain-containing protein [Sphaerisporangium sp. TRM90804]|uniref:RICIN domain-containing protein n=1 Tax=Sphaerisporangium sp. TRM90804 TaxID=3031113 RepID=UPI00244870B5|nr:RICIN domain-containing protein [Sphaerisporangium sp. TRM90804]MDH2427967.1 RICIN domain-containing protein [Sphaerisporangium sp. TRM90804]
MSAISRVRRGAAITAVAAAMAGAAVVAGPMSGAAQAATNVRISPQNAPATSMAKSPPSSATGIAVLQDTGVFLNQQWTMQQVANLGGNRIAFTFTSRSGGCLDVNGKSLQSGALLMVKACDGSFSQQWIRDFSVNATFLKLENRNSGLIATADGSTSGTLITQRQDSSGFNQRWSIFGA